MNKVKDFWDKNKIIVIGGIVVVVLIVVFFVFSKKSEVAEEGTMAPVVTTPDATPAPVAGTPVRVAPNLSYDKALIAYKDHRIQFDAKCQATPNTQTYKDLTGLMLDNRSDTARTITVGASYTIPAFGFKIIYLPDVSRQPRTILVDCGKQQNVATLLVQE